MGFVVLILSYTGGWSVGRLVDWIGGEGKLWWVKAADVLDPASIRRLSFWSIRGVWHACFTVYITWVCVQVETA